jgi:hypothetical protein
MPRPVRPLSALFFVILCSFALFAPLSAADRPEWSVIIYIGTDEQSLGLNYDPRFRQILDTPLPASLELLTEQDTHEPQGTFRTIRRGPSPLERQVLPEHDSAAPESMAAFLRWAGQNARGKKRLFMVITHSWGWRGIIQDYTIPGKPETNTMMPLRELARVMREEGFRPDVFWLDACVLGNVEPIQEFKDAAPYLIVSQREMPYNGFPADRLFGLLGKPGLTPREFVRRVPEPYIKAYARNGSLLTKEGEFFVTTVAGIDTGKWKAFTKDFRSLVKALEKTDFPARMAQNPLWVKGLADFSDHNADLVELLTRLPELVKDPEVGALAAKILKNIGYPAALDARSRESYTLDPGEVKRFELRIDADGLIPPDTALKDIKELWFEMNQDQVLPETLHYDVVKVPSPSGRDREFVVSGEITGPLRFRPWLAGAQYFVLTTDKGGEPKRITRSRDEDFFLVDRFPKTSFLVSEAHTQGVPFIHGIGIVLYPRLTAEMDRTVDPITKSTGREFYRETAWNRVTGWGNLMFR